MPAAAKAQRPHGWIQATITSVLDAADGPLSACELARKINAEHRPVHVSAVFRTLGRMLADGLIDRVELAAGYVRRRPHGAITLLCQDCGSCVFVPDDEIWRKIEQVAIATGFTPSRYVLEAPGACSGCHSE